LLNAFGASYLYFYSDRVTELIRTSVIVTEPNFAEKEALINFDSEYAIAR